MWFHSALRRIKGFIYASFVIPKEIKNILPTAYFKASSVSRKSWKQLKLFTLLGPRECGSVGCMYLSKTLEVAKTLPGAQIHVARKLKLLSGVRVNL